MPATWLWAALAQDTGLYQAYLTLWVQVRTYGIQDQSLFRHGENPKTNPKSVCFCLEEGPEYKVKP